MEDMITEMSAKLQAGGESLEQAEREME